MNSEGDSKSLNRTIKRVNNECDRNPIEIPIEFLIATAIEIP